MRLQGATGGSRASQRVARALKDDLKSLSVSSRLFRGSQGRFEGLSEAFKAMCGAC